MKETITVLIDDKELLEEVKLRDYFVPSSKYFTRTQLLDGEIGLLGGLRIIDFTND